TSWRWCTSRIRIRAASTSRWSRSSRIRWGSRWRSGCSPTCRRSTRSPAIRSERSSRRPTPRSTVSTLANTSSETDRLSSRFDAWRAAGRRALIPYVTAGYPRPADTVELLHGLVDAGADVIELGVPFSDPLADGPTIQRSTQAALEAGVTLEWTLDALARFRRERDASVVVFSCLNPVLAYGIERFLADAVAAGADGFLLTDLPYGCDPEFEALVEASPIPLIRLLAPTTPIDRAVAIARRARG